MPQLNIDYRLLDAFAKAIKDDYASWKQPREGETEIQKQVREQMVAEFTVDYEIGSTYIKFVKGSAGGGRSVHSFVVNKPTKGFQIGDVLKAASWKAPATNFARGKIDALAPNLTRWTGAQ